MGCFPLEVNAPWASRIWAQDDGTPLVTSMSQVGVGQQDLLQLLRRRLPRPPEHVSTDATGQSLCSEWQRAGVHLSQSSVLPLTGALRALFAEGGLQDMAGQQPSWSHAGGQGMVPGGRHESSLSPFPRVSVSFQPGLLAGSLAS